MGHPVRAILEETPTNYPFSISTEIAGSSPVQRPIFTLALLEEHIYLHIHTTFFLGGEVEEDGQNEAHNDK